MILDDTSFLRLKNVPLCSSYLHVDLKILCGKVISDHKRCELTVRKCGSLPDAIVGVVWIVGRDSPDRRANFGVFRNNHLAEWRGEDRRLVHVFHRHLDGRRVAKWAQAQEVGVNIPVCGFDSQREAALCFEV